MCFSLEHCLKLHYLEGITFKDTQFVILLAFKENILFNENFMNSLPLERD